MLSAILALALSAQEVHALNPEDRQTEWFKVRVQVDAAVPDGIGAGLSLAPLAHLRLSVAALTNVIGFGLRGGLAVVPFSDWTLHPLLSVDAGRYFNGNPKNLNAAWPDTLTYDFGDLHGGLELTVGRLNLFLIGGVSRIWARGSMGDNAVQLDLTLPSGKAGFAVRLN